LGRKNRLPLPDAHIAGDGPRAIWSMKPYAFVSGEAPPTVNPSLWRRARLNAAALMPGETEKWAKVIRFAGIKPIPNCASSRAAYARL
jgi:hypothetical protein